MKKLGGVSSDSIKKATGNDWQEWMDFLEKENARQFTHKEIVHLLAHKANLSQRWWQQKITSAYEQQIGRRQKGETADAFFQVGVQKTFPLNSDEAWELLTSPEALKIWLGEAVDIHKIADNGFENHLLCGEIRVLKPYSHIRMNWHPKDWDVHSILQVRVIPKGDRSVISFHQERLKDQETREEMKKHWSEILGELKKLTGFMQ